MADPGIHSLADYEASLKPGELAAFRDAQLVFRMEVVEEEEEEEEEEKKTEVVTGSIWLGGQFSVRDRAALARRGTTHVLACNGRTPFFLSLFGGQSPRTKVIDWDDEDTQQLSELHDALAFLTEALLSGGVVLVHCTAGRSRSAAVVVAFLIARLGMVYDDALAAVKQVRPWVAPNAGFERQLREFEVNHRVQDPRFLRSTDGEAMKCELCRLEKTTRWFKETPQFVIIECDQCDQPMAVWRQHTMEISVHAQLAMENALCAVANRELGAGNFFIDKRQRSITTHLHWHARRGQDPWAAMKRIAASL